MLHDTGKIFTAYRTPYCLMCAIVGYITVKLDGHPARFAHFMIGSKNNTVYDLVNKFSPVNLQYLQRIVANTAVTQSIVCINMKGHCRKQ